jgi:hypothetical protein
MIQPVKLRTKCRKAAVCEVCTAPADVYWAIGDGVYQLCSTPVCVDLATFQEQDNS